MKYSFWKNSEVLFLVYPVITLLDAIGLVAFIIMAVNHTYTLPVLIIFACIFVYLIAFVPFVKNSPFQKIIVTETIVECLLFKKKISKITWNEMISIKLIFHINAPYLIFEDEKKGISMRVSKKLYEAILSVCPRQDLKDMLKNIEWLKKSYENEE